jgi:hypothetical protein
MPLSDETAQGAKSVFVFQLIGATLREEPSGQNHGNLVEGKIRVAEVFSGPEPRLSVEYTTNWCCGAWLSIGHFYAAFLDQSTGTVLLHCGNLLPLGDSFSPGYIGTDRLRKVSSGADTLSNVFGSFPSSSICATPRPPDPIQK